MAKQTDKITFGRQTTYPYNENLSDKEFEELLSLIFNKHIELKKAPYKSVYDEAHLMPGVGEKGQDVLLTKKGKRVGLVQCKKVKSNLTDSMCAQEIIKFTLNSIIKPYLISDINNYKYYLATSTGFSETAITLLSNFNELIVEHSKLQSWTESVIKKYKIFNDLSFKKVEIELKNILKSVQIEKIIPTQLNGWLSEPSYYNIAKQFFPNIILLINDSTKGGDDSYLITQSNEILNQAEIFWKTLHPTQALSLVNSLERNIEDSTLTIKKRNPILARIASIKSYCQVDTENTEIDFNNLSIKAYNLHKEKIIYQERAARAYYDKGNIKKALEITNAILDTDEENARAWLVMSLINPTIDIPHTVKALPEYKTGKITLLLSQSTSVNASVLISIFKDEIENKPIPSVIDRTNFYYWIYVYIANFYKIFREGNPIDFEKSTEFVGNSHLEYTKSIIEKILNTVAETEFNNKHYSKVAKYDYYFCAYFLTGDPHQSKNIAEKIFHSFINELEINDNHNNNFLPILKIAPFKLVETLAIFLQQDYSNFVVDALKKYPSYIPPEAYLQLGIAHLHLGQTSQMVEAHKKYIESLKIIDQNSAAHCLEIIHKIRYTEYYSEEFINNLLLNKNFTHPYIKDLVCANGIYSIESRVDEARNTASQVRIHWDQLGIELKRALADTYIGLREWAIAAELYKNIADDELSEIIDLRMYLMVLYEGRLSIDELVEKLSLWRIKYAPDVAMTSRELSLYGKVNNYKKVAEIGLYGIEHFPEHSQFWFSAVRALHQLRQVTVLKEILDDRLLSFKFEPRIIFSLSHIYIINDKSELALEACFRTVRGNPEDVNLKNSYLSLGNTYKLTSNRPNPEVALVNMFVLLQSENKPQLYELTPDKVEKSSFAKKIINLRVNDTFVHEKSVTQNHVIYTVSNIYDKYQGLHMLILDEIQNNKVPDMNVEIFSFPEDAEGEDMFKEIQKVVGPSGTRQKMFSDEAKRKFSEKEIGFMELTSQAFGGNPIYTWDYVTSYQSNGFPIIPSYQITAYPSYTPLMSDVECVLDISSLLTLFHLKGISNETSEKLYIVSQYIIDFVRYELEKLENEVFSGMSINATAERVHLNQYSDDFYQNLLKYWKSLDLWIDNNCKADYSWDRVSWEAEKGGLKTSEMFSEKNLVLSSFIDSISLASKNGRVLVSDDIMTHKVLCSTSTRCISLEHYLKEQNKTLFENIYLKELINLNYRGMTITGDQLYNIFFNGEIVTNNDSSYSRAIHSFSPAYNPNLVNWSSAIRFIKRVYSESIPFEFKRQTSRNLFENLTPNIKLSKSFLKIIETLIDNEFELLGSYAAFVKEDLYFILRR